MEKIGDLIKKYYIIIIIGTLVIVLFLVVLLLAITISHFFWSSDVVQIFSKYFDVLFNIFSLIFGLAALVTAIVVREQVTEMKIQRMESYKPKLLLSDTHVPIIKENGKYMYKIKEPLNLYEYIMPQNTNSEVSLSDLTNALISSGQLYIKLFNIGEGFARNVVYEWKSNYSKISEELNSLFETKVTNYENDVFSINAGDTPINIQIRKQNPNRIVQVIPAKYLQPTEKCYIEQNIYDIVNNIINKGLIPPKHILGLKSYLKLSYTDKNGEHNIKEFFEIQIILTYDIMLNFTNTDSSAPGPKEIWIIPNQISEKEYLEN
ncbi:hypothetical protein HNP88_000357 [Methanococcus maripaludis]|uniref:Uncharacterized protein n=1 Tax=Methanococcus maripaludis TaxID=39152 RepID=A0A7J9NL68_METMI|nr:hypothetical protein [Methanococcus maripaludis]MBA2846173.1 hypothetical protein [Methanococcus maripaludis]